MEMQTAEDHCAGCFRVVAPQADDRSTFADKVIHEGCRGKAKRMEDLRISGLARLQSTLLDLGNAATALSRKIAPRFSRTLEIPNEMRGIYKSDHLYSANEFALILSEGLTVLYRACSNGNSRFREEIVAFASTASAVLDKKVTIADFAASQQTAKPTIRERVKRAARTVRAKGRQMAAKVKKSVKRVKKRVNTKRAR